MKKIAFAFCIFIISLLLLSCISNVWVAGDSVKEERTVSKFNKIEVSSGIKLVLVKSDEQLIKVEASSKILNDISTKVEEGSGILEIYIDKMAWFNQKYKGITVYVHTKDIKKLKVSSGSKVESDNVYSPESVKIELSSGVSFNGYINSELLDFEISSGSRAELTGTVKEFELDVQSGSKISAFELVVETADVNLSSGSMAELNVIENLSVDISSGSSLEYKGKPKLNAKQISVGSSVKNVN